MSRSTLPLFPTDDGWPYPDPLRYEPEDHAEVDLDALGLRIGPHAYDALDDRERAALFLHFGLGGGEPLGMKALGPALGCSRSEARALLGSAIAKMRLRLASD